MTKRALDKVCDVTVSEHVLIVCAFSFYDILQYKQYSEPWRLEYETEWHFVDV
jgi:hypothetical protein